MIKGHLQLEIVVAQSSTIRPFTLKIDQQVLDDLAQRLAMTRLPDPQTPEDWSQGLPLDYAKQFAAYWQTEYDWREREVYFNQFPQFVTELDGLDIHFIHLQSPEAHARPLLITHGWPGSVV